MRTIFVSSTFRDMQAERDAIRDIAAPYLNEKAHAHGDQIDFCDLRWGIDTQELDSDEGAVKVLDVCFREIDRSQPPMVIVLGDRYGWIPSREIIAEAARERRLPLDELEKSVTALEIEYGAICQGRRVFVYLRQLTGADIPPAYRPESPASKRRMDRLKQRLQALPNSTVATYTVHLAEGRPLAQDISAFAHRLAADLEEALTPDWQRFDRLSPFQREQERQWAYIREKDQMFLARQQDLDQCLALVQGGGGQAVLCRGDVGSGKSTLLSRLARLCRDRGIPVLPVVGGLTDESSDALDVLEHTVYFLEELLEAPHTPQAALPGEEAVARAQGRLLELAAQLDRQGRWVLVAVDALDQLSPDHNRDTLAFFPQGLAGSVRFFLTCTGDIPLPVPTSHVLLPLTAADKRRVIGGICSHLGRELPEAVTARLVSAPQSDSPLYVSLMLQRLLMMDAADFEAIDRSELDSDAAITARQLAILDCCPTELGALSVEVFQQAGQRIHPALAHTAVRGIAASRYGLRTGELAALCGAEWSLLSFSRLVHYLQEHFQLRGDGRWDFLHKCIRQGFRAAMAADGTHRALHKKLQLYLFGLPEEDPIRRQELLYHTVLADDRAYFTSFLDYYALGKDGSYAQAAAVVCRELCLGDGGAWLIQVLDSLKAQKKYVGTLWFVCHYLRDKFARTNQDLPTFILILKAAEALCLAHGADMSEKNRRIFFRTIYQDLSLFSNYVGSHQDAYRYAELALQEKQAQLPWEQDTAARVSLYFAYYNAIVKMKNTDDPEQLRHALEVAQQGLDRMDQAAWEAYLSGTAMLPYVDCMGEMYLRLGEREQCLAAYERGLRLRKAFYQRHPTTLHLLEMSGGYMNVAEAEAAFHTHSHTLRAFRRAWKCGLIQDFVGDILAFFKDRAQDMSVEAKTERLNSAGHVYIQTAQIVASLRGAPEYTDEIRRTHISWLHKGLELSRCAYHTSGLAFARSCTHTAVMELARSVSFHTRAEYEAYRPLHLRWLEEEKLRLYEQPSSSRCGEYYNLISGLGGSLTNSTFPGSRSMALELMLTYGKKGLAAASDPEKWAQLRPSSQCLAKNMQLIVETGDPSISPRQAEAVRAACEEFGCPTRPQD